MGDKAGVARAVRTATLIASRGGKQPAWPQKCGASPRKGCVRGSGMALQSSAFDRITEVSG